MAYTIRPLDGTAATERFSCSEPLLNNYLRCYAAQDERRGVARVFIATTIETQDQVAGYFSLSAASIRAETLPEALRKKLPHYPVPVALLGRLAVDREFQGQGLGAMLLADACRKVNSASQTLAVTGILVDAKSPQATAFYRHFGFIALPGQPARLILPKARFAIPT